MNDFAATVPPWETWQGEQKEPVDRQPVTAMTCSSGARHLPRPDVRN